MRKLFVVVFVLGVLLTSNTDVYPLSMFFSTEEINILSTTDLHGRLNGYDYKSGMEFPIGLDKISTIIKHQRRMDKDVIIIDSGDFNRGNPMTDMYNTLKGNEKNPVIRIMNEIGYDAVTPGNHEFDYGIKGLKKIAGEANFPMVSANVFLNDQLMFKPYEIIMRKGIRIGIVGFTTTSAIKYNAGDDIDGLRIEDISKQGAKYFEILRNVEKVDVIIALVHSGIEDAYKAPKDETDVLKIAELPVKPDVIISGHSHMVTPQMIVNGVIIQSPGALGIGVGKIKLSMQKIEGRWNIVNKKSNFIPSIAGLRDKSIGKLIENYEMDTVSYVNTKIELPEGLKDTTNNELINIVKQNDANSDIVISENFKEYRIKGKISAINDFYDLYGRENYIVGITTKSENVKKYILNRINCGVSHYNNVYNLNVVYDGHDVELYLGGEKLKDSEEIKVAMTDR